MTPATSFWINQSLARELLKVARRDPAVPPSEDFIRAFGLFHRRPEHTLTCFRYHGEQFGIYHNGLGDGRGFLYGQLEAGSRLVD